MTPNALTTYLRTLIQNDLRLSVMMWGPPGIGKSSIVAQLAADSDMQRIDLRLSQLAPSDLRGLPVPQPDDNIATWYPPEFLPQSGRGILFLDELNMAAPAVQGIAQQLILDRKVGTYTVPEGWFIWSAGNRKEDRAAVYEMPAPLANRFVHLKVDPDYDSFQTYAAQHNLHEQIQAFLAFRPELLFKMDAHASAWPSPRSWEMASALHATGLNIAAAVGDGAAGEFYAYLDVYTDLPDLEAVLAGNGSAIAFPEEASRRYATTMGLGVRADTAAAAYHASRWLLSRAPNEYTQLFFSQTVEHLRDTGQLGAFVGRISNDDRFVPFLDQMQAVAAACA